MPKVVNAVALALVGCAYVLASATAAMAAPGGTGAQGSGSSEGGEITAGVSYSSGAAAQVGNSGCSWTLVDGVVTDTSGAEPTFWPLTGAGGVVFHLWRQDCPGSQLWFSIPAATPADLLPQLIRDLQARVLPRPVPVFELLDREFGWAYVRTPLDFRVGGDSWKTTAVTAAVGPLWATVTARPQRLTFDPGDPKGPGAVACDGDGPVAGYVVEVPGACSYTYRNASSTSPADGYHFITSLTIDWQVSWTSSTGEGGPLAGMATSSSAPLAVAEVKGLVVCTGARSQQGGC